MTCVQRHAEALVSDALLELIRGLAVQVKFASLEQVACTWLAGDLTRAEDALGGLVRSGLAERADIEVRTTPAQDRPLFAWTPDLADPTQDELTEVAARLAARSAGSFSAITVYRASRAAANLFGVRSSGFGCPCEWTHDYRLAETFLWYRANRPAEAARWLAEGAMPKWGKQVRRMKDPDAFLLDPEGRIERVIEIAGKYSASHLWNFHRHCAGGAHRRIAEACIHKGSRLPVLLYDRVEIGYELW